MITIRTNIGYPPQGYIYRDPRIESAKWLDDHTSIEDRAREVIKLRAANPSLYPEPEWTQTPFVTQQIIDFNCARWGNDPRYCIETPTAPSAKPTIAARLCPDCNIEIRPRFCSTCSGQKILGYECPKCRKEFPK